MTNVLALHRRCRRTRSETHHWLGNQTSEGFRFTQPIYALARLDLGVIERRAILRDQRAHPRVFGLTRRGIDG